MKKTYTMPALQVNETQVENLMAVSLTLNSDKEVDGSAALSREDDGDWNIWAE